MTNILHPKRIKIIHSNTIEPDYKTNYVSYGCEDIEWLIDACIRAGRDTLVLRDGIEQWQNIDAIPVSK
jgi:hypothetical protein